jgi:Tfp pilus assembly protein PilP
MRLLVMLSAAALLSACGTAVSDRPCPRVTEFPAAVQARAAEELATLPPGSALAAMMDAMAGDRAFNRAVCGR